MSINKNYYFKTAEKLRYKYIPVSQKVKGKYVEFDHTLF